MSGERVVVATRKSALALAQTRAFVRELAACHPEVTFEELHVTTTGDRVQDRALAEIGGKGLFIKELEEALLEGRADLAVHSLKDVPPELPPGLVIGCHPRREDPRDVLFARGVPLAGLPQGARIGTSSLRRRVQLELLRSDLRVTSLRGNVDTRLRKCREGEVEAVVLARAGLVRLGLTDLELEVLEPETMLPAVAQGALGIEHRADDARIRALLGPLDHAETKLVVAAEREAMRVVEGNCQAPVAAFGLREPGGLWLRGLLAEPDGSRLRRAELRAGFPASEAEAARAGRELGQMLRAGG